MDRVLPECQKCALLKQNGSSSNDLFMVVNYVTKILIIIYVKEVDNIFERNKREDNIQIWDFNKHTSKLNTKSMTP